MSGFKKTLISPEISKELEIVFNNFLGSLPQRISELEAEFKSFQANPTFESFDKFCRCIHKLKGASGMFSLVDVYKKCIEIEAKIKQNLDNRGLVCAEYIDSLAHELAVLIDLSKQAELLSKKGV